MTNTHLVGTLCSGLLRGFVVVAIACCSTMAFAQTSIANLVDAQEAADRLSTHYPAVQASLSSLSTNDPNYAFEAARLEYAVLVFEDTSQGMEPEASIQIRFDEGLGDPAPRLSEDEAAGSGLPLPVAEFDPIVAELVNLLQQ